jgi:glycosyltransferase involved in cell wall biosynthesis
MACGKPVVTTATCSIPSFVKHGENGFLSNDESALRKYLELLLENDELREKMGKKAREMITQRFSHERFINSWNNVFNKAYGV